MDCFPPILVIRLRIGGINQQKISYYLDDSGLGHTIHEPAKAPICKNTLNAVAMRTWNFLLMCWGLLGVVHAQSVFFLPFNQSRQDVRNYLESQDYIPKKGIKEMSDMETILAIVSEDRQVEYAFQHNKLYATTVIQNYDNPIHAEKRRRECIEFMTRAGADSVQEKAYDKIVCYTGVTGERVLKLFVRRHVGSTTLTFASIQGRYFDSIKGDNKFYYEVDLLQQHMALRGRGN